MNYRMLSKYRTELMGVAMLWVMFFHASDLNMGHEALEWIRAAGFGGVDIFILLSAMGLALSLSKKEVEYSAFMARRAERILPAYYTVVIPYTLFLIIYKGVFWSSLIWNTTLLYYWMRSSGAFNWYVAGIMTFYAVTPFCFRKLRAAKYRERLVGVGVVVSLLICQLFVQEGYWYIMDVAYRVPVFFLGLVLKLVFSVGLGILPSSGRSSLQSEMQFSRLVSPTGLYIVDALQLGDMKVLGDVLRHAVLPALALGLLTAGVFIRLVRTNVISTFNAGYIDAARSRGVSEKRLMSKHAWRPALIPIITVMGMQIALLLAGAVLTETTFEWKGLGFMLSNYLKARDFVAVQGIVILIAIIVSVVNFIVDVISALIDPRVRY